MSEAATWGVAIVAAVVLVGAELRRAAPRRALRGALAGLAALGLLLLGLQPSYLRTVAPQEAVLVTPGADPARVRDLVDSLGAGDRLYRLPEATAAHGARVVTPEGLSTVAGVRRWHVVGDGWHPAEAPPRGLAAVWHPGAAQPGIVALATSAAPHVGGRLTVRGQVQAPRAGRLLLLGPGGAVDSADVSGAAPFALADTPRAAGRQAYTLALVAGRDTLWREHLPVEVRSAALPRVLVLRAAPDFEAQFFKTWYAAAGGSVVLETTLSQGRTLTETLNAGAGEGAALSRAALADFDLVWLDDRAWAGLGGARATLSQAVREGLGVLVTPADGRARIEAAGVPFAVQPVGRGAARRVAWEGAEVGAAPWAPVPSALVRPVWRDDTGAPLAAWQPVGQGRVGVVAARETFRWRLAGHPDRYARFWTGIVEALARSAPSAPRWHPVALAFVDEPVSLALTVEGGVPMATLRRQGAPPDTVFLAQQPAGSWTGRYWPLAPGWHDVEGGGAVAAFYAHEGTAWAAWRQARRWEAMAAWRAAPTIAPPTATATVPVPLGWWFALLVIGLGGLWLERKV